MPVEVELPDGQKAYFKEKPTGRGRKLMRSAGLSAATNLSEYPELFAAGPPNETDEQRQARLEPITSSLKLTPEQAQFWDNMREATVLALLDSWTYEIPIPSTYDELEDLDGDLYEALIDYAGGTAAADLETAFEPIPPTEVNMDRPTSGSSDLDGPSEAEPTDGELTTTPGSDGSPTPGDSSIPEQ